MKRNHYYRPAVNIRKVDEKYMIDMALAGWKRDEIELKLEDGVMYIIGQPEKEEEDQFTYTKRRFGKAEFQRSFIMNDQMDTDQIEAKMQDGILTIVVPQRVKQIQKVEIK